MKQPTKLVFIPSAGTGHLISAVEMAKLLVSRDEKLFITVLIMKLPFESKGTEAYISSLESSPVLSRVNFITLPQAASDIDTRKSLNAIRNQFVESHKPYVKDAVSKLAESESESTRVAGFVIDMFCTTMIDVANEFGVPTYMFFTSPAGFLGLMLNIQTIRDVYGKDVSEFKDSDAELTLPTFVNSVPARVLPSVLLNKDGAKAFLGYANRFRELKGILINTFVELESHALDSLSDGKTPPVYPVGPILNLKSSETEVGSKQAQQKSDILEWLDDKPDSSVVFLCFGSMGSFGEDQVREIAWGLEQSGHHFLWSLRQPPPKGIIASPSDYSDPTAVLPEGFLDRTAGIGKVIGWAPQVAILAHPAVGGFVSHCGWNSTLESLWFGMPVAAWPVYAEQQLNAFAQAVIMKLLTNIFKARQTQAQNAAGKEGAPAYPLRVDVHMVNFLFTEFRRHIIPQTCALIFLQGQIRAGHAHPEDFPLNLWDMERMYEGVYQYLEFFAILTEHDVWKKMMADWEITSELVTLLKELDAAIPKGQLLARKPPAIPDPRTAQGQQVPSPEQSASATPAPVAVERPYDINAPSIGSTAASIPPEPYAPASNSQYVDEPGEEPSDFEWRNLKKLTVLVLTSLVWKSRKVQDQVRAHKGIEAILSCCQYDEHNPYIKEHAIMCLRFLLEGNKDNQDLIRELEPKGTVPNEVLDQHGYETFWDQRGQVGLRRKDGGAAASAKAAAAAVQAAADAAGIGSSSSSQDGEKRKPPQIGSGRLGEPPNLDLLMQQVMRDLPAQVTGARQDAEKAAALAKLDKDFKGGK